MFDLCKYKDILGKPNIGLHSLRILDIAMFDVLCVIIIGMLISNTFKIPLLYTIISLFILGIILHRLFCLHIQCYFYLFLNKIYSSMVYILLFWK